MDRMQELGGELVRQSRANAAMSMQLNALPGGVTPRLQARSASGPERTLEASTEGQRRGAIGHSSPTRT